MKDVKIDISIDLKHFITFANNEKSHYSENIEIQYFKRKKHI